MFLCAIKDKEIFFPGVFYTLTCFAFWIVLTCALLISFDLFCYDEGKSMLVENFKATEILQRYDFYNQPMANASYFQTSEFWTSFCKADNWLVAVAAANCHPAGLKLKILHWDEGRAFLGRWKIVKYRT